MNELDLKIYVIANFQVTKINKKFPASSWSPIKHYIIQRFYNDSNFYIFSSKHEIISQYGSKADTSKTLPKRLWKLQQKKLCLSRVCSSGFFNFSADFVPPTLLLMNVASDFVNLIFTVGSLSCYNDNNHKGISRSDDKQWEEWRIIYLSALTIYLSWEVKERALLEIFLKIALTWNQTNKSSKIHLIILQQCPKVKKL